MGNLWRATEIPKLKEQFNLETFIETGTGGGDGVNYAKQLNFNNLHSVEINETLYNNIKHLSNDNVTIHLGRSLDVLSNILPDIKNNILFWLDAHYPGADYGLGTYDVEDKQISLPLESELREVCKYPIYKTSVFIIDDLRIYVPGSFENGPLPWEPVGNIDFIHDLFSNTHDILLSYKDEGYIILTPKTNGK